MMIAERVNTFITGRKPKAFCDDCIKEQLGLSRRQQAQRVTGALATTDCFQRASGICSICGSEKKVINRA